MTLLERFDAEGNARTDELAKDGALSDGRDVAQIRASSSATKRGGFRGFAVCSQLSLSGGGVA